MITSVVSVAGDSARKFSEQGRFGAPDSGVVLSSHDDHSEQVGRRIADNRSAELTRNGGLDYASLATRMGFASIPKKREKTNSIKRGRGGEVLTVATPERVGHVESKAYRLGYVGEGDNPPASVSPADVGEYWRGYGDSLKDRGELSLSERG